MFYGTLDQYSYEVLLTIAELEPNARLGTIYENLESCWSRTKLSGELKGLNGGWYGRNERYIDKHNHFYSLNAEGKEEVKRFFENIERWRTMYESRYGELPRHQPVRSADIQDQDGWEGIQNAQ